MNKQFQDIGGVRIAYLDTGGTGQAILFVHGNSTESVTFSRQLESDLAERYRLVALDLPGHGDSGRVPVTEYGVPFYARKVAALASQLGIDDAVLVGWSLGGHIVLECADIMPVATGFVIFGTPPLRQPPNIEQAFLPNPVVGAGMVGRLSEEEAAAYARSFLGDAGNDAVEAEFTREILATDPNARDGLAMSAASPYVDQVDLVARLDRPLAVFHGAQEQLVSLDYIDSLAMASLWRDQVQVIPRAGHAPHVEAAGAFNALLHQFMVDLR